jgi:hypothetical protein
MDNSTINNILNFLVTNEGKKLPEKWVQFKLNNVQKFNIITKRIES